MVIGMSQDAQFGPVIMFGLGGLFIEILKDVSFRLVPLNDKDAGDMIKEIKGYPLLQGYRGQDSLDIEYLKSLLLKTSLLVKDHPEIEQIDINPIFVYKKGAMAVDARVILNVN